MTECPYEQLNPSLAHRLSINAISQTLTAVLHALPERYSRLFVLSVCLCARLYRGVSGFESTRTSRYIFSMKLLYAHVLLLVFLALMWLSLPVSSAKSESKSKNDDKSLEGRRFLNIGPFRPFMRVLGMMGIPLLPLLLIRQLIVSGAAANQQGVGGGAGMGSLGALGILAPFGAGAGLGGIRPIAGGAAGGLRPLGLRPLGGGAGGLRPLGGLIANAANAAQNAGAAAGGSGAAALFLKKRSTEQEKNNRFSTFLGALAKLEKVVDQYDLSVPDCQRLIVCEVHRKSINPSFGSFTEKLIQAFGVEARLERSRFTSNTKTVLKDFLKAARNGLQQRDCSAIYYKCPVAVTESHDFEVKKKKDEQVQQ